MADLVAGLLANGARARFVARGTSMAPAIRDGDIVTVEAVAGSLAAGDVVAIRETRSNRLLVHRLVERTPEGWRTQGDSLAHPDGVVPDANVLGRVIRVESSWKSRYRCILRRVARIARTLRSRMPGRGRRDPGPDELHGPPRGPGASGAREAPSSGADEGRSERSERRAHGFDSAGARYEAEIEGRDLLSDPIERLDRRGDR